MQDQQRLVSHRPHFIRYLRKHTRDTRGDRCRGPPLSCRESERVPKGLPRLQQPRRARACLVPISWRKKLRHKQQTARGHTAQGVSWPGPFRSPRTHHRHALFRAPQERAWAHTHTRTHTHRAGEGLGGSPRQASPGEGSISNYNYFVQVSEWSTFNVSEFYDQKR